MADTEKTANVLVIVDAESLYQDKQGSLSTDSNSPLDLGDQTPYIYMFVRQDDVLSGQAADNLSFTVNTNNIIRWRIASLTGNTRFSVSLSGCDIIRGVDLLSQPTFIEPIVTVPVPSVNGYQVNVNQTQTYTDSYYQATAVNPSADPVYYKLEFALADNDGDILGYFSWGGPQISINS
ncbi:AidA/PixA family protein [Myxococcus sp. Y35]|uniref:AidA/PixA family protein n=1 Tax=Pseudomyxococcus flavus TaxID=3115648 RepID=UPI003CE968BE